VLTKIKHGSLVVWSFVCFCSFSLWSGAVFISGQEVPFSRRRRALHWLSMSSIDDGREAQSTTIWVFHQEALVLCIALPNRMPAILRPSSLRPSSDSEHLVGHNKASRTEDVCGTLSTLGEPQKGTGTLRVFLPHPRG
jgi:hypothetical protein